MNGRTRTNVILGILIVLACGSVWLTMPESSQGAEPPDEVVAEIHEMVQKTCFDKADLDPLAKDRCAVYVIQTLRNEYEEKQAAPPPPGSVDSDEPPPAPIIEGAVLTGD